MMYLTTNQATAIDPTRTTLLRTKYIQDYHRRWNDVIKDLLGITVVGSLMTQFRGSVNSHLDVEGTWQKAYLDAAYLRGERNADQQLRLAGTKASDISAIIAGTAVAIKFNDVKTDLRRIRNTVEDQITAALIDTQDVDEAIQIARDRINKIGKTRSRTLVNTAVVGLVATALLDKFAALGVPFVNALVESKFTTVGDVRVCPECLALESKDNGRGPGIFTLQEARGVIPVHAGCRCTWTLNKISMRDLFLKI